jgi:Zn-finger nucleic acid-binding protein
MVTMECPNCHVALEVKRIRDRQTDVDLCPKCGGVWFDDGEIAQVIGAIAVAHLAVPPGAVTKENMLCPRCRKPLALFSYPGTMSVVEACRDCKGVWLEAGEIQEIARARRERTMRCPSCGQEQPAAETCAKCGIIIRKFARPSTDARPPLRDSPPAEIPGVKGTLIRFIDSNLQSMWNAIKPAR